jgi:hypothetical protein
MMVPINKLLLEESQEDLTVLVEVRLLEFKRRLEGAEEEGLDGLVENTRFFPRHRNGIVALFLDLPMQVALGSKDVARETLLRDDLSLIFDVDCVDESSVRSRSRESLRHL